MYSEFDIINTYIKSLININDLDIELNNGDDAAIVNIPTGYRLVVSQDTYNEGTHFFKEQPINTIISHCFVAAISDLAAMGSIPKYCTLSISFIKVDVDKIKELTNTLKLLLDEYKISLIGGDTTNGPFSITFCMMGIIEENKALKRSNAQPGDLIWVSGNPGTSLLGLQWLFARQWYSKFINKTLSEQYILEERYSIENNLPFLSNIDTDFDLEQHNAMSVNRSWINKIDQKYLKNTNLWQSNNEDFNILINTYFKSTARINLSRELINNNLSNTSIDISDGLVGDLRHIAKQSKVSCYLNTDSFSYHKSALKLFTKEECKQAMLFGGDDYEIIFTTKRDKQDKILEISNKLNIKIQCIGYIDNYKDHHIYIDGKVCKKIGYDAFK